ncbi:MULTISPECIES: MerR family transcriptional regulator [Cytobacillus]|jgi:DNA-binding transcriptional MerR regulator|uniref:MerR family transcriptional regulator n=1 Tax=Cytobacillus pseudoceanisediminis TaxID=3051614 RepID=A0ABZ2ZKK6_9BACI|nr:MULTISPECIES: MerR family transcriptional regulator [Cytobacillus]EFV75338.1 transcriptional regulator [Bacillus sp. 2_A_57_CT2]MBY0156814.1 MerR family transcriptional regulator [Cytobacillus firmus]MCM3391303.1 MerR family transcriptional regulator [Cytobacillus oceanisediminis]MCM3405195.1 MerR family transcriptional regulator [Cytobacillus oceanisediminis]MCM3531908.1 MerR family transcriptional regulator [Cytobacillus oceanisediminis]
MKTYTISEVAKELNLTVYTLRYYDKEGLMPFVERTPSGNRLFKESDLSALKVIECLKATGMPIKEIKNFIDWCSEGDATLQQRYDMFLERRANVEAQMEELRKTMEVIEHKCLYYKTALEAGTEDIHKEDKIEINS